MNNLLGIYHETEKKRYWLLLSGVLALALLLRLWQLGAESAWIDEAFSIVLARHPIPQIIQGTAVDQHPPFYYLLLHGWLAFGGEVQFARILSVLLGVVGVYQAVLLGEKTRNRTLGLLGGGLLAISPIHVWYSQEVRMYILLATLTVGATYTLWDGLYRHEIKRWWLWYSLFTLLGMYTHYFSAFILGTHGLWVFAWTIRQRVTTPFLQWMGATALAGLFFLPWLPVALYQSREHALRWLGTPTVETVRDTFLRTIFGESVQALPAWGRILLLIFLIVSVAMAARRVSDKNREAYAFLGWMSLFPFASIVLISAYYPIFQYKQLLIIVTPLLVWLAWSIERLPPWWGGVLSGLIVMFSIGSLGYQALKNTKDDWREATAHIQSHLQPGDIVFGNPAAVSLAFDIYQDQPFPFTGYPSHYSILRGGWEGQIITPSIAAEILQDATRGKQRLWLVEFAPSFWDPHQFIGQWLAQHARLKEDQSFGRIRIRLYQLAGENGHVP